jgi:hypothetical protein
MARVDVGAMGEQREGDGLPVERNGQQQRRHA